MRKTINVLAAVSMLLAGTVNSSAGLFMPGPPPPGNSAGFRLPGKAYGNSPVRIVDNNGNMIPDEVVEATYIQDINPVGTLLSPSGEDWFYHLEVEGEKMPGSSEYYTRLNFKAFRLTVYDGRFDVVGYVRGKAVFPEGAARCNYVEVATQVTSTFFNSNSSDYEVIVAFNYNPDDSNGDYGAKQYSQVYTLQPKKSAKAQNPLFVCPGLLQNVVDGSTNTTERYLLSFMYESSWTNEPKEAGKNRFYLYQPVKWGGKEPELLATQTSYANGGDGINDAAPFFATSHAGEVYTVHTYYEKPLFDYSQGEVPVMTPDNNFVVELYKPTVENPLVTDFTDSEAAPATPWKSVTIPVTTPEDENYIWRSYAIGNFLGEQDVTWDFSSGEDPCLIVSIVDSNVQEDKKNSFRVYDTSGNMVKEFGSDSSGYIYFQPIAGQGAQLGFEVTGEEGLPMTQLVDWPSLEVKGEIPGIFEHDGSVFYFTSTPTRVAGNGEMLYAANVVPYMDEEYADSSYAYVAYFNAEGELHRMDALHLPDNTAKAYAYVDAPVLDPYLYNTDTDNEYLIWLYTWKGESGGGTDLSLCVVNDEGDILASRRLPDGHSLENAYVSDCLEQRFIVLSWRNASEKDNPILMELISLPLNQPEGKGTADDPYLIKTYGDFNRVRSNLSSHFALACDVDMEHRAFTPIEGTFTGTIDGRGHTVKNLYLSVAESGALFEKFGERPEEETDVPSAVMKNITFDGVSFTRKGTDLGTKIYGILAAESRFAEFDKVKIINPEVEISGVDVSFGVFANTADNVSFTDCAVKDADIDIERAKVLGGIAGDPRVSEFRNVFVSGSFKGRANVGSVAGVSNSEPSLFENVHVVADLNATDNTAGGIIASDHSRSSVRNCIVEGTIKASSRAGGITGNLAGVTEDPEDGFIIADNVVNISAMDAGENPEAVHRIVGYTSIDDGEGQVWIPNPNWNPDDPNSSSGHYESTPAVAEKNIGKNYVVSALQPFDTAKDLPTEGTTVSLEADDDLFQRIGFMFGTSSDAPWTVPTYSDRIPHLYFETTVGKGMAFESGRYEGKPSETVKVNVVFDGIDPVEAFGGGFVEMKSSNESVAFFTGMMDLVDESTVSLEVSLGGVGSAQLTLSYNGLVTSTTMSVDDGSGVDSVSGDFSVDYAGGVLTAPESRITLFDLSGRQIARAYGRLDTKGIGSGIYVAVLNCNGMIRTLKISVP